MKKQLLLLLLLPAIYSCIPQAFPIPTIIPAQIKFTLPEGVDKAEIKITDPNCTNINLCKPTSLSLGGGRGTVSTAEVPPGNKVVTIRIYKGDKVISEITKEVTAGAGKDNSIIIPVPSSTSTPIPVPTSTSTSNQSTSPSVIPTVILTPTPTPISTPTATATSTPTPTATPTFSSGGGGGGLGNTNTPIIQVSATINPDNTGVK